MRLASCANQCRSAATAKGRLLTSGWVGLQVVPANAKNAWKTTAWAPSTTLSRAWVVVICARELWHRLQCRLLTRCKGDHGFPI